MRLKKGDKVKVLSGKDRGREGEIMRVITVREMVIVDRVNIAKRHTKATNAMTQGGIIDKDMPIHVSNVAIVCSSCGPTRIGIRYEGHSKVRICRKCNGDL
ncbi:MAG: 50S ribosomal protein L24 [Acidimicrobiales bacterium]|nr:50S ribosomal protein L24 [Acidimicrobiales bacterium]